MIAAMLGLWTLSRRRWSWRLWVFFACGFLAAMGPLTLYIWQQRQRYFSRVAEVSIFTITALMAHLRGKYGGASPAQVVVENLKRVFLTYGYYHNAFPGRDIGRPFFDAVSASLLALGFGYVALRPLRLANWVVGASFVVITALSAFAGDPPSWQRMAPALPFAAILAALAADQCATTIWLPQRVTVVAMALLLTVLGWDNWTRFVRNESQRVDAISLAGRYAMALAQDRILLTIRPPFTSDFLEFRFPAPHVAKRDDSLEDATAAKWPAVTARPVVIFAAENAGLIPVLQATSPNGMLRELTLTNGSVAVYAYEAP